MDASYPWAIAPLVRLLKQADGGLSPIRLGVMMAIVWGDNSRLKKINTHMPRIGTVHTQEHDLYVPQYLQYTTNDVWSLVTFITFHNIRNRTRHS